MGDLTYLSARWDGPGVSVPEASLDGAEDVPCLWKRLRRAMSKKRDAKGRKIHVNDSKKPLGSRIDRHEHIGKGCIGLEPVRRLLNDPRFGHLPMILETEKSEWREKGKVVIDPLDEMNLNTLRSLRKT